MVDCQGKHLTPGFIDVQINGSHGCDYSKEPTLESIEHSRRSLLKTGECVGSERWNTPH